jgi:hypothetical protein
LSNKPDYGGLTVTPRLKLDAANGWTRAFFRALSMHPAAGVPAAGPATATLCTCPSEEKMSCALDG